MGVSKQWVKKAKGSQRRGLLRGYRGQDKKAKGVTEGGYKKS